MICRDLRYVYTIHFYSPPIMTVRLSFVYSVLRPCPIVICLLFRAIFPLLDHDCPCLCYSFRFSPILSPVRLVLFICFIICLFRVVFPIFDHNCPVHVIFFASSILLSLASPSVHPTLQSYSLSITPSTASTPRSFLFVPLHKQCTVSKGLSL